MSRSGAVLFLVAAFAMQAAAADMPSRKAGLWEVTTPVANHPMKMQQCIDAATDQAMQSQHLPRAPIAPSAMCRRRRPA